MDQKLQDATMNRKIATLLLIMLSPLSQAADYLFDKVHTQILFKVSHMGFSHSTGAFVDFDGKFNFNKNDFSDSSVNVTIQVASLNLNDDTWNEHMLDKKWFDVNKYPTMEFTSTKVVPTGESTMDVIGQLTIKGVTKPATLQVTVNKVGVQMGKRKAGFSATTRIDRSQFGMDTYAGMIGTDIDIHIEAEGLKQSDD
jgi:polyisoprenoid-binding protein YceI